ncbi:HAD family hydrolase [Streptomyces sp. NPDC093544]|uniref:HAD family hydrolase n=1 Tax=Streptomyces sp. NPDC093544 TaxID=3155200 RepID=UPI0034310B31
MAVELDDIKEVRELLAGAHCVLFDFDGPICRLFPKGSSLDVADELRKLVDKAGLDDVLTEQERADKDPHVVLRAVNQARMELDLDLGDLVKVLEERVTEGELDAVQDAWSTPRAGELIQRLREQGRRLAVVTNNSAKAADSYLKSQGLAEYFASIHGRGTDPALMKPNSDVVTRALRSLKARPEDAVMIGDTPTDVEAAQRAGVRFIGYGRNARKESGLREAGATLVLASYDPVLDEV